MGEFIAGIVAFALFIGFLIFVGHRETNTQVVVNGATLAGTSIVLIGNMEPDYRGKYWNPQQFMVDETFEKQENVTYLCTGRLEDCRQVIEND